MIMVPLRGKSTGVVLTAALLLGPALAGCSSDTGGGPTPSPTTESPTVPAPEETSPAPEPTTEPEETQTTIPDTDADGNLIISTQGLGPLKIGLPPESNPGQHLITFVADYCYDELFGVTEGDLDRWITTLPGGPEGSLPFMLDVDADSIYRIDVFNPDWKTAEGIGIGSPIDDLLASYPDIIEGPPGPTSKLWLVQDEFGTLAFETQTPDSFPLPAGVAEGVTLIRILRADVNPNWHAANSGNVAGACF